MDKLKNQKGIAFIPILIWTILISGTVFIAQDAVKRGYIAIDSPYIVKETPTPQPTTFPTPLPTYKPTPTAKPSQGQVQRTASNTHKIQQPTHDGSRTGPIVDYNAYCEHKTIKVYENELIPFTMPDGQQIYATKGDIDCFNRNWPKLQQLKNQTSGSQNTQPSTINCYDPVTKKDYQVSKETCDKWVQEYNKIPPYTPPQYYSCTICYSTLGTCSTYNYMYKTKEECDTEQQRINQQAQDSSDRLNEIVNRTYKPQYTTPTFPVPTPLKIELSCTKYYDPFGGPVREECR